MSRQKVGTLAIRPIGQTQGDVAFGYASVGQWKATGDVPKPTSGHEHGRVGQASGNADEAES